MAQLVLRDAVVTLNGVNLSAFCKKVTLNYKADLHDSTTMGASSRRRIAGLTEWDLAIEFTQSLSAGGPDDTLFSLVGAVAFPVTCKATSEVTGVENPEYQGDVVLENYQPIDGGVGELSMVKCTVKSAGDLTRATA